MKRNSPILFFTLLDFFLVIIFFGFLMYALSVLKAEIPSAPIAEPPGNGNVEGDVGILIGHFKTPNFSELTDKLVRMVPADFEILKWSKLEIPGVGKPHCLPRENNPRSAKILASVISDKNLITFTEETPNLTEVLDMLELEYEDVQSLSLGQFGEAFAEIVTRKPDCRYTLEVTEVSGLTKPRDVIEKLFYRKPK